MTGSRLLAFAAAALLAACNSDPLNYIPAQDRSLLQAQHRLGEDAGASASPISVEALLSQARSNGAGGTADGEVTLRYQGAAVQPDDAQRAVIRRFAAEARDKGRRVTVVSRQDSFDDAAAPLLGQRRGTAVARELQTIVPEVDLRFDPGAAAGVVVLSGGRREPP